MSDEDEYHAALGGTVDTFQNSRFRRLSSPVTPFLVRQAGIEDDDFEESPPLLPLAGNNPQTPESIGTTLRRLCHQNNNELFKATLVSYLIRMVPTVFMHTMSPADLSNPTHEGMLISRVLMEPLQKMLVGDVDFNEAISKTDVPSGNCGKIFKIGEPTYSCRDCGVDPTCVLCIDCFNTSGHKNHRYKMSSSCGGGYCDCGDLEAWRQDAICLRHQAERRTEETFLPPKEEKLASVLFETLLQYANDVLSNEYAVCVDSIPVMHDSFRTRPLEEKQDFATILYNDEVHTFDLVIQTLTRAMDIENRIAVEFATNVDREGRAILKTGSFEDCVKVKNAIMRHTHTEKPLIVEIRQSALVSHQYFAIHFLKWTTKILNISSGYRRIFNKFATGDLSFVRTILLNDTKFWKSVRAAWHHLLIAGFLKEYDIKKTFATIFSNCYSEMMVEFSQDDNEHTHSITSLSVQIFTVPSLAVYLIEERRFLVTIMRTILSETEPRLGNGKLQYERRGARFQLRRTHYALVDLKYLLSFVPTNPWTPALRSTFSDNFRSFIMFCGYLHGSDPITRQTGEHVEFEPDWETAFNIHVKLAPVITLALEWCAQDEAACLKAYRSTLLALRREKYEDMEMTVEEYGGHLAACNVYDITTRPVSIYLALTRLLAGLFLKLLQLVSKDVIIKVNGQIISHQLRMESPLRTLTLLAQRHAGMWKRNGFSVLNQVFFYQNVRCRADMYDMDIVSLQIAASEIENNEFILNILHRFQIIKWLKDEQDQMVNLEDNRYNVLLAEEFLFLVMTLVSARFCPGVGLVSAKDVIRKQIIQSLCIGPMTHSELNRCLVEDIHGETGIETVVGQVADFKRTTQGDVYELRPEFYAEYDVFYYHYMREEMSKAEEAQRARKLTAKEPDIFPPPKLPAFAPAFENIVNLLKADVLLQVFKTVFTWCLMGWAWRYSDGQLRKIFHLICHGLNEESEMMKTSVANSFGFTEALERKEILPILHCILQSSRASSHREIILWILQTHSQLRPTQVPLALNESAQEAEELRMRKIRADAAKARSMASISNLQMKFRTVNADLFVEEVSSEGASLEEQIIETVCLGKNRTAPSPPEELTCILCMDKQDVLQTSTNSFVVGCCIQLSTVISQWMNGMRFGFDTDIQLAYSNMGAGHFISSCGHTMHQSCWQKHQENGMSRERRRAYRQQQYAVDQTDSFCPMCECLHNTLIPVIPPLSVLGDSPAHHRRSEATFEEWDSLLQAYIDEKTFSDLETEVKKFFWPPLKAQSVIKISPQQAASADRVLTLMEKATLVAPIVLPKEKEVVSHHTSLLTLWNAVAFTITSMEMSNREQCIPFFGKELPSRQQLTLRYITRLGGAVVHTRNLYQVRAAQLIARRVLFVFYSKPRVDIETTLTLLQEVDPFSLVVIATHSFPFLFADCTCGGIYDEEETCKAPNPGSTMDMYIFRVVFVLHMTQLLCKQKFVRRHARHPVGRMGDPGDAFVELCKHIWHRPDCSCVCWDTVLQNLEQAVTPFVCCCAKWYECYTGIEPTTFSPQNTPLSTMLKFLGQPTHLGEYFKSPSLFQLALSLAVNSPEMECRFPRTIQPLVTLPDDYLDLMNSVSGFACRVSKSMGLESRHPTLCLVCGTILCSQSVCCQEEMLGSLVGACTAHAASCGLGTGMFLRIKESKVFVKAGSDNGAYVPPPYVDEYGETDQGLRRGNPLRLSSQKYAYLRRLWINHAIPDEIVRVNTKNAAIPSHTHTDWERV